MQYSPFVSNIEPNITLDEAYCCNYVDLEKTFGNKATNAITFTLGNNICICWQYWFLINVMIFGSKAKVTIHQQIIFPRHRYLINTLNRNSIDNEGFSLTMKLPFCSRRAHQIYLINTHSSCFFPVRLCS